MYRWIIGHEKRGWKEVDIYIIPTLTLFLVKDFKQLKIEWLTYSIGISCGREY